MKVIIILLLISIISCKNNTDIKKEYDRNGNLSAIHYLRNNKIIDSSHIYVNNKINQKLFNKRNDSINFVINYDSKGKKTSKGYIVNKDIDFRIKKWHFFKNKIDSVVEFVNFKNKTYSNQIWVINNKTRDTIIGRGNHFRSYYKDTIGQRDTLKLRFYLYEPLISYESDMMLILSEESKTSINDFSNVFKFKRDTFYSLENDGIPHPELPDEVPQNHNVNFGIIFENPGTKYLTGYISEYIEIKEKDSSTTREERRIFFKDSIYVNPLY